MPRFPLWSTHLPELIPIRRGDLGKFKDTNRSFLAILVLQREPFKRDTRFFTKSTWTQLGFD